MAAECKNYHSRLAERLSVCVAMYEKLSLYAMSSTEHNSNHFEIEIRAFNILHI